MSKVVLGLVDDLITASRLEVDVQQAGGAFHRLGTQRALTEALRTERPAMIVIDLDGMGFDGVATLEALKNVPAAAGIPCVAFGSHVDAERLQAALDAGAEASLSRSQFLKQLPARVKAAVGG